MVVISLAAVLLITSVKPPPHRKIPPSLPWMTKDEFQLRVLDHWFPAESTKEPPADVRALLGLARGDELEGGWKVRGIRVDDNAIRIEVVRPSALFVARVQLGAQEGSLVQTKRYSLTATNERPGPQFFADLDQSKPVEDIAKHVRAREAQVPVPRGLTSVTSAPAPGLPGTFVPAEPAAPPSSAAP